VKGEKEWSAGGVRVGWAFQEQYAPRGGYFLQGGEQGNEGRTGQEIKDLTEAERAGPAPGLDGRTMLAARDSLCGYPRPG